MCDVLFEWLILTSPQNGKVCFREDMVKAAYRAFLKRIVFLNIKRSLFLLKTCQHTQRKNVNKRNTVVTSAFVDFVLE